MQTDTRERIRVRIAWTYGISIIFLKEAILFLYYHHDFCYVSATSWTKIFVWRPIESDSQSVFAQFREREIQMLLFLVPGVLALLANSRSGRFRRFSKSFFLFSSAEYSCRWLQCYWKPVFKCLCRTDRMLIVWKSAVEFPLVSKPAFKGLTDRTTLMVEAFLKRESIVPSTVGRPSQMPAGLCFGSVFDVTAILGRCWCSREPSGLSLWIVVRCVQHGNCREYPTWAGALQRQPVMDSPCFRAGNDGCLSLSPRYSLSLGLLAKLQFCTSCAGEEQSDLQHLLCPCRECCNRLRVVCSDHQGWEIQNGKTWGTSTAWRRHFSVTLSNILKV